MSFIWPTMLFALPIILPLIVAAYVLLQRRRRALTLFDGFSPATGGGPHSAAGTRRASPGRRRHAPALFFLLGLAVLLFALARPQATLNLPRVEGTVMLVFDVSASMGATDGGMAPDGASLTRLEAAKAAAREFVLREPSTVQIGVVSFSGTGFSVQAPTNDPGPMLAAINRLQPTRGTSLGQGIFAALKAVAVDAGLAVQDPAGMATPDPAQPEQGQGPPPDLERWRAQLPEGRYPAAVIVLLSDGEDNQGLDPREAAAAASEHGVAVHALGFGTVAGTTLEVDGYFVHTTLDEVTLQEVTAAAGGRYFTPAPLSGGTAGSDQNPQAVYDGLNPQLVVKPEAMEITALLAGAGLALLLAGMVLSLLWFNRLV